MMTILMEATLALRERQNQSINRRWFEESSVRHALRKTTQSQFSTHAHVIFRLESYKKTFLLSECHDDLYNSKKGKM